jgi:RNA polymerase sigma-70 factor (ECF subfamily)
MVRHVGTSALATSENLHAEPSVLPSIPEIYDQYFSFIWRNLRHLGVPEVALEDAVQDVFVVVHRKLPEFEGRASLRSWLFGIVMRVAKDHRRSIRRRSPAGKLGLEAVDPDGVQDDRRGPREEAELSDRVRLLHELLQELDETKRTLLVLAELEQMTAPEISEVTGMPVNTVYTRLRAARRAFDEALARRQDPNDEVES